MYLGLTGRLRLVIISILFIIGYSIIIILNTKLAQNLMLGYCGLVLTFFVIDQLSREKHVEKT